MNKHAPIIYLTKNTIQVTQPVYFNKIELGQILNLYGKMVSAGEWRDYSLEEGVKSISFNIYRRACDQPIYRILKSPQLASKQGAYAILGQGRVMIKRGHCLKTLLKFFNNKLFKVID